MTVLVLIVSFVACSVGAICGIGGGILIKPVLDATGVADVSTINFLSSCTVLAMTLFSVVHMKLVRDTARDIRTDTCLAIGSAVGGIAGKELFSLVEGLFADPNKAGAVQALLLLVITMGTLIFTLESHRFITFTVTSLGLCICIGLALGICSSFLGIGGGPINLVVLSFFFSMDIKHAASVSLYIILFSQITSVASILLSSGIPDVSLVVLVCMIASGILGGVVGRRINARIQAETVNKLFVGLMVIIIVINAFNIYRFVVL